MLDYRQKIYRYYSSQRTDKLAPVTVDGFKPREPYLLKVIHDHFPPNKDIRILEIGCGHGVFMHYIQQAGYVNSLGIDGSQEQVEEARRLGIKNVILGDLVEYLKACEKDSIDLLVAFDVIEHFTKTELSALVDHFYRVLRPGSKIILHTPNAEGPFGNFMRHWDFTHEIAFTRQSLAQLFLASGFSAIGSNEDKPIPHGMKSFIRYCLWQYLIRKIYCLMMIVETGRCEKDAIFSQNFLTVVKK